MKKIKLPSKLTTVFRKAVYKIKESSPEILIAGGVVGVIVSTVKACQETLKVTDILEDSKKKVGEIHECREASKVSKIVYSDQDYYKDLVITYTNTGWKLTKLYAPSLIIGAGSLVCILSSHHIQKRRNLELVATCTAMETTFKEYRKRVAEKYGDAEEEHIHYGVRSEKVEEVTTDENGKEKKVKKEIEVANGEANMSDFSPYAVRFDRGYCTGWENDKVYNQTFLTMKERYLTDKLIADRYLFLCTVFDELGAENLTPEQIKMSHVVGWIYNPKHPTGDNFVQFKVVNLDSKDDLNKYKGAMMIDFNCDGTILDKFNSL